MSRGWDEGFAALGAEPWRELAPRRSWDELVLPEELLARLREVPELYRRRPETGGPMSMVLLFGGPSGVGKTSAALGLAADLGYPVLEADVEDLLTRDPPHAPQLVTALISRARQLGGVLVLDRSDMLLRPRRDAGAPELSERAAAPLLALDRDGKRLPGLVIFCAELAHDDPAVRVHFDRSFVFPQLDAEARALIWQRQLPPLHLVPAAEITYVAEAFRISGKSIARCCSVAAHQAAGRAVTLHDVAEGLEAEYQDRLASDWTRAALAEVRDRAMRVGLGSTGRLRPGPGAWPAPTPPRPAPAPSPDAQRRAPVAQPVAQPVAALVEVPAPAAELEPERAHRSRRDWLALLGVTLTGAIVAVALGIALAHHSSAKPTTARRSAVSGPRVVAVAYRSHLAQTVAALNRARTNLSRQLAAARSPAAQAQAAYALSSAHMRAASALLALDAGSAVSANQDLVGALQKAGVAYSTLAHAAQTRDARGYASAQQAVSAANASVSAAMAQVRATLG